VSREIVMPALPARIGKYELVEPLGVGGMAEVFKARSTGAGGFERLVVIKKILPAHCQDPDFLRMFIAEAKILGMLHHPNVIQAYDFGEEDGVLFLVLEYADGPSLMRALGALRMARRPMPPAIAAHFAHELCRALDYVHGLKGSDDEPLGVIHRDVTPGNVVLTSSGGLKLLDFGVARYSASVARSEHGTLKGKAAYLAPEALAGRDIDHRVDIFSAGAVLHEMLTGDALFAAGSHLETIWRILEAPIPRPSSLRSGISRELDAVVMKALERDPRRRYASAAEMARDLNEVVIVSRLHADQVRDFVRDVQAEIARQAQAPLNDRAPVGPPAGAGAAPSPFADTDAPAGSAGDGAGGLRRGVQQLRRLLFRSDSTG